MNAENSAGVLVAITAPISNMLFTKAGSLATFGSFE